MQILCTNCHKPFAIGKEAIHAALDTVEAEELSHFNTQCPHCRRVNRISAAELHRAAPDWVKSTAGEEKE